MRVLIILTLFVLHACSQAQEKPQEVLVNANADEINAQIASFKGEKPVLVNFWATWCIPCIEEFPYIMDLKKKYGDNFELIFVSGDFDEARGEAQEFLKEQQVDFTTYFKTGNDNEFITKISDSWTGALPYTVVYDREGNVSAQWEGKAEFETFEAELLKVIKTG